MKKNREVKDLDELWDETAGTPMCPKCESAAIYGHINAVNRGKASVDWVCEDCGHKWSICCPFEDGCLTPVEDDGSWIGFQRK